MPQKAEKHERQLEPAPLISVLAGTNGAGKSSIGGAMIESLPGGAYFNPDRRAKEIRSRDAWLSQSAANALAWKEGVEGLERAVATRTDYAFETTLGRSETILSLLERAARTGFSVFVWYAGLSSPELHIQRVRARVAEGGHDIPEDLIRERYGRGIQNLIRLLPSLTALRVYDNSKETPPSDSRPEPELVLHVERGKVLYPEDTAATPEWARPIVAAALALQDGP